MIWNRPIVSDETEGLEQKTTLIVRLFVGVLETEREGTGETETAGEEETTDPELNPASLDIFAVVLDDNELLQKKQNKK